jgi:hypothetical protein
MAVLITSTSALSVAANSKSADQVSGQYQYTGKGRYTLVARASATGLNVTFASGGISPVNDQVVTFTGTAGALSAVDHVVVSQLMNGGRNELTFRNTTSSTITVDSQLWFDPM